MNEEFVGHPSLIVTYFNDGNDVKMLQNPYIYLNLFLSQSWFAIKKMAAINLISLNKTNTNKAFLNNASWISG